MLTFKLQELPPSTNVSLMPNWNRKGLTHTPVARAFRESATEVFKKQIEGNNYIISKLKAMKNKELKVKIILSTSWYLKNTTAIKKKDIANLEKLLLDSLFEAIRDTAENTLDDSQIFSIILEKLDSSITESVILLELK